MVYHYVVSVQHEMVMVSMCTTYCIASTVCEVAQSTSQTASQINEYGPPDSMYIFITLRWYAHVVRDSADAHEYLVSPALPEPVE